MWSEFFYLLQTFDNENFWVVFLFSLGASLLSWLLLPLKNLIEYFLILPYLPISAVASYLMVSFFTGQLIIITSMIVFFCFLWFFYVFSYLLESVF